MLVYDFNKIKNALDGTRLEIKLESDKQITHDQYWQVSDGKGFQHTFMVCLEKAGLSFVKTEMGIIYENDVRKIKSYFQGQKEILKALDNALIRMHS